MTSPSQTASGLARVYQLYRQVLRIHRTKLPPPLRSLGDSYVKGELRRHLKGKTTDQQWREFGDQWCAYVSMLSGRADADEEHGSVKPLHDAQGALNEEQLQQLQKLKDAALELGGNAAPDGKGGCGGGGANH